MQGNVGYSCDLKGLLFCINYNFFSLLSIILKITKECKFLGFCILYSHKLICCLPFCFRSNHFNVDALASIDGSSEIKFNSISYK